MAAEGTTEANAGDLVRLTLEPSLQARMNLAWEGAGTAPRIRMTLVGEDAVRYGNVDGGLHAAGGLRHACNAGETMTFAHPLEPEATYAIRYEGWSDSDQRQIEAGMTAFMPAAKLTEGVTITPTERWIAPRILASEVGGNAEGELRARLRTSEYGSPVSTDGTFDLIGGESDPDVLLIERDGMVEASLSHDRKDVMKWLYPLMHADPDGVLAFLDSGTWTHPSNPTLALSILSQTLAPLRPNDALSLVRSE
ncbi:MAG: hypothetical protein ACJA2W_000053 [Planctomycetota bacterium]|jgi:hypothetical protein